MFQTKLRWHFIISPTLEFLVFFLLPDISLLSKDIHQQKTRNPKCSLASKSELWWLFSLVMHTEHDIFHSDSADEQYYTPLWATMQGLHQQLMLFTNKGDSVLARVATSQQFNARSIYRHCSPTTPNPILPHHTIGTYAQTTRVDLKK
jgi:hypothetical protein